MNHARLTSATITDTPRILIVSALLYLEQLQSTPLPTPLFFQQSLVSIWCNRERLPQLKRHYAIGGNKETLRQCEIISYETRNQREDVTNLNFFLKRNLKELFLCNFYFL